MDEVYRRVYEEHGKLLSFLSDIQVPLPDILRVSAEFVLGNAIGRCLAQEKLNFDYVNILLEISRRHGLTLATATVEPALRKRLDKVLETWKQQPCDLESLNALEALVTLAQVPPLKVDLWRAQNVYYELLQAISDGKHVSGNNKWLDRVQVLGNRLGIAPSQLVSIPAFSCSDAPAFGITATLEQPCPAA
jgi:hypothetical protein